MTIVLVELSGEALELARAEAVAVAEAFRGGPAPASLTPLPDSLVRVSLSEAVSVGEFSARLALAHRVLIPLEPATGAVEALRTAGHGGRSASIRRLGRPRSGASDPPVLACGRAYKDGGGTIDLGSPERRFWLVAGSDGGDQAFEEVGSVDRSTAGARRMPNLPFQRPVSLPPTLARAATNLARVRPGDSVVDPFLGTGALLAEAGLLGAKLYGIDRDPAMVRGALRNFAHFGLHAEELIEGDGGSAEFSDSGLRFDALVADPPYGRSSGTGGEAARSVVERIVPRWAERVRPGGRVVLVLPGGFDPLGPPWVRTLRIPVRVHRSLTREFCAYDRTGA